MSEELIIAHCAPTLAGIKIANLFNCSFSSLVALKQTIESYNSLLNPKGVHLILLNVKDNRALIYVFRPTELKNIIDDDEVKKFLSEYGYSDFSLSSCLKNLISKLSQNSEFPHEIGIFLGYPVSDVKSFITHKGKNFKAIGYWKVYHDEAKACLMFEKYRKCTQTYKEKLRSGCSFESLVIAVN